MLTRKSPLLLVVFLLGGCAGAKPVLYPNAHLKSVGKEGAESDIQDCQKMAETAGAAQGTGKAGQVAGSTAVGAGVGAASGAVGGAIVNAGRQRLCDRSGKRRRVGAADGIVECLNRILAAESSLRELCESVFARKMVRSKWVEIG
jgi:hypothetical protein